MKYRALVVAAAVLGLSAPLPLHAKSLECKPHGFSMTMSKYKKSGDKILIREGEIDIHGVKVPFSGLEIDSRDGSVLAPAIARGEYSIVCGDGIRPINATSVSIEASGVYIDGEVLSDKTGFIHGEGRAIRFSGLEVKPSKGKFGAPGIVEGLVWFPLTAFDYCVSNKCSFNGINLIIKDYYPVFAKDSLGQSKVVGSVLYDKGKAEVYYPDGKIVDYLQTEEIACLRISDLEMSLKGSVVSSGQGICEADLFYGKLLVQAKYSQVDYLGNIRISGVMIFDHHRISLRHNCNDYEIIIGYKGSIATEVIREISLECADLAIRAEWMQINSYGSIFLKKLSCDVLGATIQLGTYRVYWLQNYSSFSQEDRPGTMSALMRFGDRDFRVLIDTPSFGANTINKEKHWYLGFHSLKIEIAEAWGGIGCTFLFFGVRIRSDGTITSDIRSTEDIVSSVEGIKIGFSDSRLTEKGVKIKKAILDIPNSVGIDKVQMTDILIGFDGSMDSISSAKGQIVVGDFRISFDKIAFKDGRISCGGKIVYAGKSFLESMGEGRLIEYSFKTDGSDIRLEAIWDTPVSLEIGLDAKLSANRITLAEKFDTTSSFSPRLLFDGIELRKRAMGVGDEPLKYPTAIFDLTKKRFEFP